MGEKAAAAERAYQDRLERSRESFRQDQITEGLRNLARIFEGGDYGYGYVDPRELRAGQKYYTAEGQEFALPTAFQGYQVGDPTGPGSAYLLRGGQVIGPAANYTQQLNRGGSSLRAGDQFVTQNADGTYTVRPVELASSGVRGGAVYRQGAPVQYTSAPTGFPTSITPGQSPRTLGEVYGVNDLGSGNAAYWEAAALLPQLYREKKTTTGFDEAYHNRMRDAYMSSATPQIEDAYEKARRELAFSLSRAGTGDSSMATRRYADLDKDFRLRQQEAANSAQDLVKQSKLNIASARQRAEDTLYSSSPTAPEQAAQAALAQANALASGGVPNYSPMGVLFQNASAGLAGYADAARYAGMERRVRDEYEGLRAPGESSARTVRS